MCDGRPRYGVRPSYCRRTRAVRALYVHIAHARRRQSSVDMREKGFSHLYNSYTPIVVRGRYILIYEMVWDGIYLDTPTMGLIFPYGDFATDYTYPHSSSTTDLYPLEKYISPSSPQHPIWFPKISFVYSPHK